MVKIIPDGVTFKCFVVEEFFQTTVLHCEKLLIYSVRKSTFYYIFLQTNLESVLFN